MNEMDNPKPILINLAVQQKLLDLKKKLAKANLETVLKSRKLRFFFFPFFFFPENGMFTRYFLSITCK